MRKAVYWILTIWIQLTFGFNFTHLNEPTGAFLMRSHDVYISYNNWRFVFYYDLTDYYNEIDLYKQCLEKMRLICDELPERTQCEVLVTKHEDTLSDIKMDIDYLEKMQYRRKKRDAFLGSIGSYFYKPIFGLMDEDDAMKIVKKINQLIDTQTIQQKVVTDNMSISKQAMKTTHDNIQSLKSTLNTLNSYVLNITEAVSTSEGEIKQHITFNHISSLANLITSGHQRTTNNLKDVLQNTLRGEYTEFITHKQLTREIKEVARDLDETSFMIIDKFKDLQRVVAIRGTISQKKLLVELNIPMVSRNQFKLHKIITLPMRYQNKIIALSISHQDYLVDNATRTYVPIQFEELQKCKPIFRQSLLCFPQPETYFESDDSCESNILFESDIENIVAKCKYFRVNDQCYVKLLEENTYFVMPRGSVPVIENCLKQDPIHTEINATGILKLEANCELLIKGMKISTKNIKSKEIANILAPHRYRKISLSNLTNLSTRMDKFKGREVKYLSLNDDFEKLINETDENIKLMETAIITEKIEMDIAKIGGFLLISILIVIIAIRCIYKAFC